MTKAGFSTILIAVLLVAATAIAIFLMVGSWNTISHASNQKYEINAKTQDTDATTPGTLGIFVRQLPKSVFSREKEVIRMINWHSDAQISFIDSNKVFVATYHEKTNLVKTYSLLNLSISSQEKLSISSSDELAFSDTFASDSSGIFGVTARHSTDIPGLVEINVGRVNSIMGDTINCKIYVPDCDSLTLNLKSERTLILDVRWVKGSWSKDLCFTLPELVTEIIDPSCI